MSEDVRLDPYKAKQWLKRQLRPYWNAFKKLPYQIQLFGARTAARVFPFVSIEQDRLYSPAQICFSTAEWLSKSGKEMNAAIREVDTECTVQEPLPKTVHESVRQQFYTDQEVYPAT